MRKISLIILLSSISSLLWAQLSVTLPTITAAPGSTISIPVRLVGASSSGIPIGGANIQITFDPTVLTYQNLVNFYSGTPQSQWFFGSNSGTVSANWLEPSLSTVAIPDSAVLYEIQFTYLGGDSPLTFVVNEFTDAAYNLVPTTPVNGAVNHQPLNYQVTFNVDMSRQAISPNGVHLAGSFNNWNPSQTQMVAGANNIYTAVVPLEENNTYTYRFVNGDANPGMEAVPSECGVPNGSGFYERTVTIPSQNTLIDTVCFSMCGNCPVDVAVTFNVDMSQQTISPQGVHLAGTFNNFNCTATAMTAGANNVYSATVLLTPGEYHIYRFVNGSTTAGFEAVPSGCGSPSTFGGYDRYFSVPENDSSLSEVCFGSCVDCGSAAQDVNITFRVDMALSQVSPAGVHLFGDFQGWDPSSLLMNQESAYVYSVTVLLNQNAQYSYKFINGNTLEEAEIVPATCSTGGNRTITAVADSLLNVVCFARCGNCNEGTVENSISQAFLEQNYPNPFTGTTHINFGVPVPAKVKLIVFNCIGETQSTLFDGYCQAGIQSIAFDQNNLKPGIYFYQLHYSINSQSAILSQKMVIR